MQLKTANLGLLLMPRNVLNLCAKAKHGKTVINSTTLQLPLENANMELLLMLPSALMKFATQFLPKLIHHGPIAKLVI